MDRTRLSGRLTVASLMILTIFVTLLLALHVHRSDLDPARHFISEYALGPTGFLMAGGFLRDAQVNFLSALLSSLALAGSYRRDARWKSFFLPGLGLSLLIPGSFVFVIVALETHSAFGLANRCLAVSIVLWLGTTAWRLRRIQRGTA